MDLLGIPSVEALRWSYKTWVKEALAGADRPGKVSGLRALQWGTGNLWKA